MFGTPPIPVPDTSVSAILVDIHTGTENTGTVPNTPSCIIRSISQTEDAAPVLPPPLAPLFVFLIGWS